MDELGIHLADRRHSELIGAAMRARLLIDQVVAACPGGHAFARRLEDCATEFFDFLSEHLKEESDRVLRRIGESGADSPGAGIGRVKQEHIPHMQREHLRLLELAGLLDDGLKDPKLAAWASVSILRRARLHFELVDALLNAEIQAEEGGLYRRVMAFR